MKKSVLIIFLSMMSFIGNTQVGIFGGGSIVKGYGVDGVYKGLHLGVEVPKDDMVSFFGRIVMTLPNSSNDSIRVTAIDPTTTFPSVKDVSCKFSNSVFNFQCGTRYYLGNGYDYGVSAYGGSMFEIGTMGVKRKITGDYDETKYQFSDADGNAYPDRGRIIALNLGLNAGVKYNTYYGVFYLDLTGSYALFGVPSNSLASEYNRYSQLNFGVNLGYRKDIF